MKTRTRTAPATAQTNAEARNEDKSYLLFANPDYSLTFGPRHRLLYAPPTAEEIAATAKAAEDAQNALIERAVAKVDEKYKSVVDGLSAEVRKLKAPKEKTEDDPKPDPKGKPSAADKELADRLAKIEERDARVKKNATRNALKSAFAAVGVTGEDEADAVDLFLTREGSKLIYDDENDRVLIKDSELYEPKAIDAYIGELNKAGKLKRFQRAVETPPADGAKGGSAGSASGNNTFSAEGARMGTVSRDALRKRT